MPITLAQAKELSQDKLTGFVIDEFRKSALLDMLPFDNTVKPQGGTTLAYAYNRVKTLPQAAGRSLNTEYKPQEADTQQVSVNLKVFGGSFQIDRVLQSDEKQVIDLAEFQLQQKTQAARALFHDWFINGDSAVDEMAFDGLDKAVAGSSTDMAPAAAMDLSTSAGIDTNWKVLLDSMRRLRAKLDGAPSIWLMNTEMFGVFQSVMDRAGINLASKENYGDEVAQWGPALVMALGDKPGTASPIIPVEAGKTAIYVARMAIDGVHGVTPDGTSGIRAYLPDMTTPGAVKTGEVEMVAAMALKATRAAGVLRGVKIA